jgi:ribulose-phosphate 3-epimerase
MSIVCPTITATTPEEFDRQMSLVAKFAHRIHIDLMDGDFAPTLSPSLSHVWWPAGIEADLHIMYRRPQDHIHQIIELKPSLVVLHAEAEISFEEWENLRKLLSANDIRLGVALLADTSVGSVTSKAGSSDHALIFSGNLGHHGGVTDLNLLSKVADIKKISSVIEIGWDGGINDENAGILASAGIDVLNVGSGVHHHKEGLSPEDAYDRIFREVS